MDTVNIGYIMFACLCSASLGVLIALALGR